jgi:phosphoribosylformimino-5-aminoimidazole carboxamide ribotide isomerase
MIVIPVIDVKSGLVVHAREGKRDDYRPLMSPLCQNSDPVELIQTFAELFSISTVYIADLDAIEADMDVNSSITAAMRRFGGLTFWLDQGFQTFNQASSQPDNCVPVLGSESYHDGDIAFMTAFGKNFVLSLDYLHDKKIGGGQFFSRIELWPENIIIMTLDRVGSHAGPDLARLETYCLRYPEKKIIAAGGVRNVEDLTALKGIGVQGVLLASALHTGAITPGDVALVNS